MLQRPLSPWANCITVGVICKPLPTFIGNMGFSVKSRIGGGGGSSFIAAPTVNILWAGPIFQNTLQSVCSSLTNENSLNSNVLRSVFALHPFSLPVDFLVAWSYMFYVAALFRWAGIFQSKQPKMRAVRYGIWIPTGLRDFLFSKSPRPSPETNKPLTQFVWVAFPGVKRPGREADYSLPCSIEVENETTLRSPWCVTMASTRVLIIP